ncbi:unnamed protein product [marine sediment metagenome]|uniref:HNH nuclease domain-containing protein n=1 Tax=marine sediment metagenome TaxID=412755 RepID=X1CK07_9ZZZZ
MAKTPTVKQKKLYHMCNCEYCIVNTPCEICRSDKSLQRSHIIPQRILEVLPEDKDIWDKARWQSYEDLNVILLCKDCHKKFDLFKLNNKELDLIRNIVVEVQRDFLEILKKFGKTVIMGDKMYRKLELWVEKQHNWLTTIK